MRRQPSGVFILICAELQEFSVDCEPHVEATFPPANDAYEPMLAVSDSRRFFLKVGEIEASKVAIDAPCGVVICERSITRCAVLTEVLLLAVEFDVRSKALRCAMEVNASKSRRAVEPYLLIHLILRICAVTEICAVIVETIAVSVIDHDPFRRIE